jgi:hypothetical protein
MISQLNDKLNQFRESIKDNKYMRDYYASDTIVKTAERYVYKHRVSNSLFSCFELKNPQELLNVKTPKEMHQMLNDMIMHQAPLMLETVGATVSKTVKKKSRDELAI